MMETKYIPINPYIYRALAIKHGLMAYRDQGLKMNTMYTPQNMMRTAENITGLKFKPRDYTGAIEALGKWVEGEKARNG